MNRPGSSSLKNNTLANTFQTLRSPFENVLTNPHGLVGSMKHFSKISAMDEFLSDDLINGELVNETGSWQLFDADEGSGSVDNDQAYFVDGKENLAVDESRSDYTGGSVNITNNHAIIQKPVYKAVIQTSGVDFSKSLVILDDPGEFSGNSGDEFDDDEDRSVDHPKSSWRVTSDDEETHTEQVESQSSPEVYVDIDGSAELFLLSSGSDRSNVSATSTNSYNGSQTKSGVAQTSQGNDTDTSITETVLTEADDAYYSGFKGSSEDMDQIHITVEVNKYHEHVDEEDYEQEYSRDVIIEFSPLNSTESLENRAVNQSAEHAGEQQTLKNTTELYEHSDETTKLPT